MKITLIQIDLVMGARVLLSLLKEKGHEVKALQINIRYTDLLSEGDLGAIYKYAEDSEVVGLSCNTFYARIARQVGVFLKKKGIKHLIVGGNHATALPDEVVEYADIIVKYEAEITLPKILDAIKNKTSVVDIEGVVSKEQGSVLYNSKPPLISWELDKLPFQCVDTELIKYFSLEKKIYTPKREELFSHSQNCYFILASRGCPFECTYCSNNLYQKLDKRFKKVRKRSIANILNEMEYAILQGFESFYITDDNFFSFTIEEIKQFNHEYKGRIKKPFSVIGVNPNNFKSAFAEAKLKLLIQCGLSDMRIGVQSGSDKTLLIFKRGYKAEEVPKLLVPIERNRKTIWKPPHDKLNIALDFICDAAWETKDDKAKTVKLAQKALSQYSIFFYTLIYLPGTEIYTQALKNGWVEDKENDIYLRGIAGVDDTPYNRILFLIAVAKERGISLSDKFIDYMLKMADSNPETLKTIVNSFIDCITIVERYHKVSLTHAALHPYLTGFNEWTKTVGKVGKKVLFRSYHEPYG